MLIFVVILPFNDALTKYLVADYPPPQILALRFAILLVMIAPAAPVLPRHVLRAPPGRGLLVVRGLLIAGASMFYVAGLASLSLATMAAVAMLVPLIVTAVSPFLLGQRVRWVRYSAIVFGFAGVLVVLRPTADGFGQAEALALGAPVCFSAYVILTRRMGRAANQIGQLMWTSIGALALLGTIAWFDWHPVTREAFGLLLIAGVISLFVYLLQIAAFGGGDTSVISSIGYLQIPTAAAVGYLYWGTVPDLAAWIGMAMIIISGVIVALRS